MTTNYFFYKTSAFLLILLTGFVYILTLGVLLFNISSSITNSIRYLYALCTPTPQLSTLFTSIEFPMVLGFSLIWILLVVQFIASLFRLYKKYGTTKKFTSSLTKEQRGEFFLIEGDENLAFTAGLLKPAVYVSKAVVKNLTQEQVQSVLEHEQTHKKEFDPLRNLLVEFILSILPPWPKKQLFLSNYITLGELYADQRAAMAAKEAKALIEALLIISKSKTSTHPGTHLLPGFALHNNRIEILVGRKLFDFKHFFTFLFIVSLVVLAQLLFLARTSAFSRPEYINECFANVQMDSNSSKPMSDKDQRQSTLER